MVGQKEVDAKSVSPRKHGMGKEADLGSMPVETFLAQVVQEARIPY